MEHAIISLVLVHQKKTANTKSVRHLLARCRMPLFRLTLSAPSVNQRCINRFDFVCSLGNRQVINELVKFIQETYPFITKDKQTSFLMKYEDLAVQYNLPLLVIPRKYTLPNITFFTIWKIINL